MTPNDDAAPYIGPASKKIGKNLAVHSVLERSASLEFRLFGSSDLYGLAGTRVAAGGCCTVRHGESTKTDNTNLAAALQSAFDAGKYGVDSATGISLGQARGVSDSCNKIVFVHGYPQYLVGSTTSGVQCFEQNTKKKENAPSSANLGHPSNLEGSNAQ
jgi:hypothetical protein